MVFVHRPGGQADAWDVEEGWRVKAVNGSVIADGDEAALRRELDKCGAEEKEKGVAILFATSAVDVLLWSGASGSDAFLYQTKEGPPGPQRRYGPKEVMAPKKLRPKRSYGPKEVMASKKLWPQRSSFGDRELNRSGS